ncbi:hypothetical protein GCM10018790_75010 [Kitasatospora xanthocidica]|nr:hypothetical protein GCM10018790_75010 [Kitasatospora xanthocidica]
MAAAAPIILRLLTIACSSRVPLPRVPRGCGAAWSGAWSGGDCSSAALRAAWVRLGRAAGAVRVAVAGSGAAGWGGWRARWR